MDGRSLTEERKPLVRAPRSRLVWVLVSIVMAGLLFAPRLLPSLMNFAGFTAALSGCLLYMGLAGQFMGISLARRMAFVFVTVLVMWGLSMLLPHPGSIGDTVPSGGGGEAVEIPTDSTRAENLLNMESSINRLSRSSDLFFSERMSVDSAGPLGDLVNLLGDATGATAGVLVETVFSASNVGLSDTMEQAPPSRLRNPRLLFITLSGAAVSVLLLVLLRGLVLVDRKGATLRMYRTLVILVFILVFYVALQLQTLAIFESSKLASRLSVNIPYILVIVWSFLNGFRNKWTHYLSRSSKYLVLIASAVVTVLSWDLLQSYIQGRLTVAGTAAGTIWGAAATVSVIYSGMAFLSILMQLPSAKLLDRRYRELRALQGVSQTVHATIDRKKLAEIASELGTGLIGADFSWMVLETADSRFRLASVFGTEARPFRSIPDEWYSGILDRLISAGGCILLNNYPRNQLARLIGGKLPRIGSLLASTVELQGERMGLLISAGSRQFAFTDDTRGLYGTFARQIAVAFANSLLIESSIERERLEEELNLARGIQMSLLPGKLPEIAGYEISALTVPSRKVGGDFYDTICMSDGRCAVAIADVAGKGASAALLMAALQASLHALLEEHADIGRVVAKLNHLVFERMPEDKFITFFLGFLDPAGRTLTYCGAGHDHPLMLHADGTITELGSGGLVLGIVDGVAYEYETVPFGAGDRLVMYTDGITETFDPSGREEFGRERLAHILGNHPDLPAPELLERIINLVDSYRGDAPQADDMTLVVIAGLDEDDDLRSG
jgi:sigma-B regulation protein RsbU (phosphoserine phosphatase)